MNVVKDGLPHPGGEDLKRGGYYCNPYSFSLTYFFVELGSELCGKNLRLKWIFQTGLT